MNPRTLSASDLRACLAEWRRRTEKTARMKRVVRESHGWVSEICECSHPSGNHATLRNGYGECGGPLGEDDCGCKRFQPVRLLVIADLPEAK